MWAEVGMKRLFHLNKLLCLKLLQQSDGWTPGVSRCLGAERHQGSVVVMVIIDIFEDFLDNRHLFPFMTLQNPVTLLEAGASILPIFQTQRG